MSRGPSGRIVVEVNPILKKQLHAVLASEGRTLKDWFVSSATRYLEDAGQLLLGFGQSRHEDRPMPHRPPSAPEEQQP